MKTLRKFLRDHRGIALGGDIVVLAIMLIISIVVTPVVVDEIQNVNTTGWTFTGASGAKTLLLLIPFVWIGGLVVALVLKLLGRRGMGPLK